MGETTNKVKPFVQIFAAVSILPATGASLSVSAQTTMDEAVAAFWRGEYPVASEGFRTHAEQGVADAQLFLGIMYDNGIGVREDDAGPWRGC